MIGHSSNAVLSFRENTIPVMFALMIFLLAASCRVTEAPSQRIGSVKEAVNYPLAESFLFTGKARTEHLGIYTWRTPAYRRPVDDPGYDPHAMWVVPVVDRSNNDSDPVCMWVTLVIPGKGIRNGKDLPEHWFSQLRASFDGREVKAKVMVRAGEGRGSGWEKAIRIAEQKYRLKSHPSAPVVAWPPPESIR